MWGNFFEEMDKRNNCLDEPEIGDVDEGVVEGGEDTGNAKDELTYRAGHRLAKLVYS